MTIQRRKVTTTANTVITNRNNPFSTINQPQINVITDFDFSKLTQSIKLGRGSHAFCGNDLMVTTGFTNQEHTKARVTIRIGVNLLKELGWVIEDCVAVYHEPDNLYKTYLMKAQNGYKLKKYNNDRMSRTEINWRFQDEAPLTLEHGRKRDHQIIHTRENKILAFEI